MSRGLFMQTGSWQNISGCKLGDWFSQGWRYVINSGRGSLRDRSSLTSQCTWYLFDCGHDRIWCVIEQFLCITGISCVSSCVCSTVNKTLVWLAASLQVPAIGSLESYKFRRVSCRWVVEKLELQGRTWTWILLFFGSSGDSFATPTCDPLAL